MGIVLYGVLSFGSFILMVFSAYKLKLLGEEAPQKLSGLPKRGADGDLQSSMFQDLVREGVRDFQLRPDFYGCVLVFDHKGSRWRVTEEGTLRKSYGKPLSYGEFLRDIPEAPNVESLIKGEISKSSIQTLEIELALM
jgi:hypothetical protein